MPVVVNSNTFLWNAVKCHIDVYCVQAPPTL